MSDVEPPREGGSTIDGRQQFENETIQVETRRLQHRIWAGESDHRRHITLFLVWLLLAVVIAYPTSIAVMEWNGKKHEGLSSAFNAVLPVVAGLVGSAVAYYFSRGDRHP